MRSEYKDTDFVAMADAIIIPINQVRDEMFSKEILGQTIAFKLKSNIIVATCNGVLEVMYPTGHAFAIRMKDGTGVLVHVGINTVNLNGKGFKVCAKQGQYVSAGQKIVEINRDFIKESGYDSSTMLIITETPSDSKISFVPPGDVNQGQIISL